MVQYGSWLAWQTLQQLYQPTRWVLLAMQRSGRTMPILLESGRRQDIRELVTDIMTTRKPNLINLSAQSSIGRMA